MEIQIKAAHIITQNNLYLALTNPCDVPDSASISSMADLGEGFHPTPLFFRPKPRPLGPRRLDFRLTKISKSSDRQRAGAVLYQLSYQPNWS